MLVNRVDVGAVNFDEEFYDFESIDLGGEEEGFVDAVCARYGHKRVYDITVIFADGAFEAVMVKIET